MKRTKYPQKEQGERRQLDLLTNSMLMTRSLLASLAGMSHEGDRNLFKVFGYPENVTYQDCLMQYRRHDIAKAIINRPVTGTWKGDILLQESKEDKDTALETAWKEIYDELGLKDRMLRADRLSSLGRYGVLLLGLSDVESKEDAMKPVEGAGLKLKYVKPLGELSAVINSWDNNPTSPRYGLPYTYNIQLNTDKDGGPGKAMVVHHTRVIHIVPEKLESDVYGVPVLEAVYNRLMDLMKLVGGSAEMFWRGARPGYHGKMDMDYNMTPDMKDDLREELQEYEHGLRRFIVNKGLDIQALESQVEDPSNPVDVQLSMISAVTGIPKRILMGSERGELASSQDLGAWKELLQARRDELAGPKIVRPLVDRLIEFQILPEPVTGEYNVQWEDLFAPSEEDKAKVGDTRAGALQKYSKDPMAQSIVPPTAFLKYFLGLDDNQIEQITELLEAEALEEEREYEEQGEEPEQDEEPVNDEPEETEE